MQETGMNRPGGRRRNASNPRGPDKLLSFPGITEAIELVQDRAYFRALEKTMDAATKGELGDEVHQLLNAGSDQALDQLLEDDSVLCFMGDTEDEILEDLALEAGPKIAELWELSEPAGERLSDFIYWGEDPSLYAAQPYWLPFVLVVNTRRPEALATLRTECTNVLQRKAVVVPPEGMRDGHIYLDVTYLPQKALSPAYASVAYCRDKLGIRRQDLREGAPPSVDGQMALRSAALQRIKGSKQAARELGFRIYTRDNRSGSYPLFRKYSKMGNLIERKLDMLDAFIRSLEDNPKKT